MLSFTMSIHDSWMFHIAMDKLNCVQRLREFIQHRGAKFLQKRQLANTCLHYTKHHLERQILRAMKTLLSKHCLTIIIVF